MYRARCSLDVEGRGPTVDRELEDGILHAAWKELVEMREQQKELKEMVHMMQRAPEGTSQLHAHGQRASHAHTHTHTSKQS